MWFLHYTEIYLLFNGKRQSLTNSGIGNRKANVSGTGESWTWLGFYSLHLLLKEGSLGLKSQGLMLTCETVTEMRFRTVCLIREIAWCTHIPGQSCLQTSDFLSLKPAPLEVGGPVPKLPERKYCWLHGPHRVTTTRFYHQSEKQTTHDATDVAVFPANIHYVQCN